MPHLLCWGDDVDICILCGADSIINRQENSSRTIYNCPYCGVFVSSDPERENIIAHKAEISALLMTRRLKGETDAVLISYQNAKLDKDYLQFTTEQLVGRFPKTFAGQMDSALYNLGLMSRYPGYAIRLDDINATYRLYVLHKGYDAVFFMLTALKDAGYISFNQRKFPCDVTVSPKGWERFERLTDEGGREDAAKVNTRK